MAHGIFKREGRERVGSRIATYDGKSGDLLGYVMNVSSRGVSLSGRLPVTPEVLELNLQLPRKIAGRDNVHLYAQRRWFKQLPGGRWVAGFRVKEDYSEWGALKRVMNSPEFNEVK